MDNTINSLVSQSVGFTDQQVRDYLTANPNMNDAQIVKAMQTYGIKPAQMASATGLKLGQILNRIAATVPPGQTIKFGDMIVQPQYQTIGSGQDEQIGPLENVLTYTEGENKVGGSYDQYDPEGNLVRQGTQQKVDTSLGGAIKDIVSNPGFQIAALAYGGNALMDALGGTGAGSAFEAANAGSSAMTDLGASELANAGASAMTPTALQPSTTGLTSGGTGISNLGATSTLGDIASTGADYSLGTGTSNVTGMGTGITNGYSGLGLNAGTAGLGADGLGAGITAGSGLTGTGVLTGSELGTSLLGNSALSNLAGTGVLAGSGLGTSLLGTGASTGLTGTGVLTGSNLGTSLLGTGTGSAVTGGVTGLGGSTLGTGALTTGVGSGGGLGGVVGAGTGNLITGGGTGLGTGLTSLGTGLGLSALGTGLGALANQAGISDARNLINQYGTQAGTNLATAYQNAQNLNAANRTDLTNNYSNASTVLNNLYNQQVGYQQPYQAIGQAGSQGLLANQDYFNRQFGASDLNEQLAPNYAFQLQQGQMANQRAANMGGGSMGGNALQGLQRYTQDYAGNAYQNAFNNFNTQRQNIYGNLSKMADIGNTSAAQLANLGSSLGGTYGNLSSNYGSNLTTNAGKGIDAANAYGLNTAGLATGIGSALASNATQSGANTSSLLSNLGNTALLGSMLKAT